MNKQTYGPAQKILQEGLSLVMSHLFLQRVITHVVQCCKSSLYRVISPVVLCLSILSPQVISHAGQWSLVSAGGWLDRIWDHYVANGVRSPHCTTLYHTQLLFSSLYWTILHLNALQCTYTRLCIEAIHTSYICCVLILPGYRRPLLLSILKTTCLLQRQGGHN